MLRLGVRVPYAAPKNKTVKTLENQGLAVFFYAQNQSPIFNPLVSKSVFWCGQVWSKVWSKYTRDA